MPKDKDLKRRVRARMRKTGESYTAARARIVARETPATPLAPARTRAEEPADLAAVAGMSDAAVRAKTGRSWSQWVATLDAEGAAALPHRDIARRLREEHGLPGWWSQMVTVGYERLRGLREKGQRRGGTWDVGKSKTVPVPIARLYAAFGAARRRRWLAGARPIVRKATREKSLRLAWEDGTSVDVYFRAKGPAKSQVQVQHGKLPSKAAAERARSFWTERLAELARMLAS